MAEREDEIPYSSYPGDAYPEGQMDEKLFMSLTGTPAYQSLIDLFKAVRENPAKAFGASPRELIEQNPRRQKELRELQAMDQTPAEDHDMEKMVLRDRLLALQVALEDERPAHILGRLLFQRYRHQKGDLNETDGKKMDRSGWATWKDRTDEEKRIKKALSEGLRNRKPSEWGEKTREDVRKNLSSD